MRTETTPTLTVRRTIGSTKGGVVRKRTLVFEWAGGDYIEVALEGGPAKDVINVRAADGSIAHPFTQKGLALAVDDWINNYGTAALFHEIVENWPHY